MARRYSIDGDQYSLTVEDNDGDVRLHLAFKKPAPPPSTDSAGRGARIRVPATDHHRRRGVLEDDVIVLAREDGMYEVESRSEPGSWHVVTVNNEDGTELCECLAGQYGRLCRHVRAVRVLEGRPMDAPLRQPAQTIPIVPLSQRVPEEVE